MIDNDIIIVPKESVMWIELLSTKIKRVQYNTLSRALPSKPLMAPRISRNQKVQKMVPPILIKQPSKGPRKPTQKQEKALKAPLKK